MQVHKVVLGMVLLFLAGCAGTESLLLESPKVKAVWPSPPDTPRIMFLRELSGSDDIAVPKGKWGKLVQFMTGDTSVRSELSNPYGIASDGNAFLYVADPPAGVVHKFDLVNRETTYITHAGQHPMASPAAVALDAAGNLYVSDSVSGRVHKFDNTGNFIRDLEPATRFMRPAGIAINSLQEKLVVDVLARKVYVFDKNDLPVAVFPKTDSGDELNAPTNIAVDRDNNFYVTDSLNFVIKVYDREGKLKKSIGQVGDAPGSFARPKGVAVDSDGNIYVVDGSHDNFQIFNGNGELLLVVGKRGRDPGNFSLPSGIAIDRHDRIYVADAYNHRIQIFQYLKQGHK